MTDASSTTPEGLAAEQLRLAENAAEFGLWDLDPATDTLLWPPRLKAMFGISPDAPIAMTDFYAGLHPEDAEATTRAFEAAIDPARRALYDVEYRTIGKEDGVVRWVAAKGRGLFDGEGRCTRVIGVAIDITSRKAAHARLEASEASLASTAATLDALLDNAPLGLAFFDAEYRYRRVNAKLAEINGVPLETHHGRTVTEVVPVNAASVMSAVDRVFATGASVEGLEIDGETAARPGDWRSWLTSFFPVLDARGEVTLVGVTVVDITGRRRAEAAVRDMNETLEAQVATRTAERDRVWRNSRDLLLVVGDDGIFRAVSPSISRMLGYAPESLVGRHVRDVIPTEEAERVRDDLAAAAGGADLTNFETRARHKDGSMRWLSWHTSREGEVVFAYGRDVTEEKAKDKLLAEAEEALRQSQKMEAIGQLTGGIAHDFNNLLQGVAGSLDLIRRKPEDAARVRRWAEAGLQAAERGSKLTGQLLAFSRSQKLELKPLDVSVLVASLSDLLDRTLGPTVRVTLALERGSLPVLGDETQLEMAVLNLAINARDAMPEGGDIIVATRRLRLEDDAELAPGDYAELSVADSGVGMEPEVASRAFDPFFTTKGVGKGTGLGLSQVYGMVRQAGGAVRIDSRPGAGTTVRLLLRSSATAAGPASAPGERGRFAPARAQVVLAVDDDADVRRFLADSLETLGYVAIIAEDGPAGLAALDGAAPDVMIVDFAMPGMTGADVAREARTRRPELPILFASGFSETAAIEAAVGPGVEVLRKPFGVDDLADRLAAALASLPV